MTRFLFFGSGCVEDDSVAKRWTVIDGGEMMEIQRFTDPPSNADDSIPRGKRDSPGYRERTIHEVSGDPSLGVGVAADDVDENVWSDFVRSFARGSIVSTMMMELRLRTSYQNLLYCYSTRYAHGNAQRIPKPGSGENRCGILGLIHHHD